MDKDWKATLAEYKPDENAVIELTIDSFDTAEQATEWINRPENKNRAVYVWHKDAVTLDNPYFAMIETDAYKAEYKKMKDWH